MFNGSMESSLSKCASKLLLAVGGEKWVEREGTESTLVLGEAVLSNGVKKVDCVLSVLGYIIRFTGRYFPIPKGS